MKKTLPKNFEALLEEGDLAKLKKVFESCGPDARGGHARQTALAFDACPDELARWLVDQGADLSAADTWGNTPLHSRARSRRGNLATLIALGADVDNTGAGSGTPLHAAADAGNVDGVRLLVEGGAAVDARNAQGLTPLELALQRCSNSGLEDMAALAGTLLAAGASTTPAMKESIRKIGERFEFHRDGFDPATRDAASAALERLYRMFDVEPVRHRNIHDGVSPIHIDGGPWQQQHQTLWDLLVPSAGPADIVQGEVIRISGRIADELGRNGGINWNADYRRLADALREHLRKGDPLPTRDLEEADALVEQLKRKAGEPARLMELAVAWVARNPAPIRPDPTDTRGD